jgi:hypothetical protein
MPYGMEVFFWGPDDYQHTMTTNFFELPAGESVEVDVNLSGVPVEDEVQLVSFVYVSFPNKTLQAKPKDKMEQAILQNGVLVPADRVGKEFNPSETFARVDVEAGVYTCRYTNKHKGKDQRVRLRASAVPAI